MNVKIYLVKLDNMMINLLAEIKKLMITIKEFEDMN
jgi:hypothetical protein